MNSVRKWIRNVFGFSGTEINGFLILIPLMLVLVFSEPMYRAWVTHREWSYDDDLKLLDSLAAVLGRIPVESPEKQPERQVAFFNFDPNAATVAELQQLGCSPGLSNRIAAYRAKGGVFRVKSDLMKIYGLDSALYGQLYNYISLPTRRIVTARPADGPRKHERIVRERRAEKFDINTVDTTLLKSVYGIGSVLANRIIRFRDGLGGFVSPQQLTEVYGLDSMVVKRLVERCFITSGFVPERININSATETELSRHPYIRYDMARVLVNYRFQHGDFMEASDIKKLSIFKPEEVDRILPYLRVMD